MVSLMSPTFLQNVKVSAIATVSNLLNANATIDETQSNATIE